jgi:hypothetical protein
MLPTNPEIETLKAAIEDMLKIELPSDPKEPTIKLELTQDHMKILKRAFDNARSTAELFNDIDAYTDFSTLYLIIYKQVEEQQKQS